MTAPARRDVVRTILRGVPERRALAVVPDERIRLALPVTEPDRDADLRTRDDLPELRQAGVVLNHKRVDRIYAEASLQVRRRRRKKVPLADRQPLVRPARSNEV